MLSRFLAILLLSGSFLSVVTHVYAEKEEAEVAAPESSDTVQESIEDSDVADAEPRPPHDPTLVNVSQGQLRGVRETSHSGKEFYSFRGIPFAAPPIGELRFKPPEKANPWEGVYTADADPPRCPQMSEEALFKATKAEISGQEDCLYLNVFSPMYEQVKPNDPLLPVMVFIHGGAYFFGGAEQYQPYLLMSQDIVLVVIQYRLGTLGFLSTEDDVAPGNMGILDQTFALDWIQKNAATFGGNPLSTTLFGESAGASSVHLQMLSHTSLGFFHRAILQSGTTVASWGMATNHRAAAYFIAKMLGCGKMVDTETSTNCTLTEDNPAEYESCLVDLLPSKAILKCISEAPLDVLVESPNWFIQFLLLPIMMGPRVDKNILMQDPMVLLKESRFKKMDIMMGTTRDEGALFSVGVYANEGLRSALRHKFDELGPLALDLGPEDIAPLNQTIRIFDRYVGSSEFERDTADNVTAMLGDKLFWYPQDTTAYVHADDWQMKKKKKNVFVYEFAYRGAQCVNDAYQLDIGKHWITHGADLMYLFGAHEGYFNFKGPLKTDEDKQISELMVKMWTDFAAKGNPTPDDDSTNSVNWKPFSKEEPRVMIIDLQPRMSGGEKKAEIREFWRSLPLKSNLILFPDSIANLTDILETVNAKVEATVIDTQAGTEETLKVEKEIVPTDTQEDGSNLDTKKDEL